MVKVCHPGIGGSIRLIEVFPGWRVNTFTHGCLLSTEESGTQTIIEIPPAKMGLKRNDMGVDGQFEFYRVQCVLLSEV